MNAQLKPTSDTTDIQYIPLAALRLSPLNARKTGGTNVADLVASLPAHGLMQNLTVVDAGKGQFEVVAGGRRLRAMQQLLKAGKLPEHLVHKVPCQVIANGAIIEASAAENSVREPMHAADQFEAFQAMVAPKDGKPGKPITDVAAHFGVSELVVKRRLQMAAVAPKLLQLFREDKLTLEQIMAYAVTADHKAQLKHYDSYHDQHWEMLARDIRRALTKSEIPTADRRVLLVGLDVYRGAGGATREDLFDDAGGGFILDEPLLNKLVADRIAAESEQLQAEGWSFVQVMEPEKGREFVNDCNQSQPKQEKRKLDATQTAQLVTIKARKDVLAKELDKLDEAGDGVDEDDPRQVEFEQLESEIEALESPVEAWSDRQRAGAGAVVYVDPYNGTLQVRRGLIPASAKTVAKAAGKPEAKAVKKPELSESMLRRLTTHRTLALQHVLLQQPAIALAAVADALVGPLLYGAGGHYDGARYALGINVTKHHDQDKLGFDDVTASPLNKGRFALIEKIRTELGVPGAWREFLPWLLTQKQDVVCRLIALAGSMTLNAAQGAIGKHPADAIAEAACLNMADHWQPTAKAYFSLVSKSLALEGIQEVHGKNGGAIAGQLFTGALKKDEFAGISEQVMARTGWLPKPLRGKGYALKAGAAAKPAEAKLATKPAKKPAAKKVAAKKQPAKKAVKKAIAKTAAKSKAGKPKKKG